LANINFKRKKFLPRATVKWLLTEKYSVLKNFFNTCDIVIKAAAQGKYFIFLKKIKKSLINTIHKYSIYLLVND